MSLIIIHRNLSFLYVCWNECRVLPDLSQFKFNQLLRNSIEFDFEIVLCSREHFKYLNAINTTSNFFVLSLRFQEGG